MREIKFRAWHAEDKVMIYDLNSPRLVHGTLEADDYILMQYTGLKDKNDKEIYEGDIITLYFECTHYDGESTEITDVVKYTSAFFSVHQAEFILGQYDTEASCEIIGNIYENEELIGE